jgi:hypothetical protein
VNIIMINVAEIPRKHVLATEKMIARYVQTLDQPSVVGTDQEPLASTFIAVKTSMTIYLYS